MKPSTALLAAMFAALLAISATAARPLESAPGPSSSGTFPSSSDMSKCWAAIYNQDRISCVRHELKDEKCCGYLNGISESCSYVPLFETQMFHGILKNVCDGGSAAPPVN